MLILCSLSEPQKWPIKIREMQLQQRSHPRHIQRVFRVVKEKDLLEKTADLNRGDKQQKPLLDLIAAEAACVIQEL